MIAAVLFALYATQTPQQPVMPAPPEAAVYNGRANAIEVQAPRIEAEIQVDGRMDEVVWQQAALLTGFSQNKPVEGRPAADSTDVRVWYSATSIYFGIRAFAPSGATRGKLSDRDKIEADDYVQIILDTFNDRRQAFVFGVNPLGVQGDGIRSEGGGSASAGQPGGQGFNSVDLSPDFVYESKGQLLDDGYQVEVRIPFKSLRYQATAVQDWGLNIYRKVQHSGFEDTWTQTARIASFLGQSGKLQGLRDLRRGLVLDLNPVITGRLDGTERPGSDASWGYDGEPDVGGNVRWGVLPNLTLNGTINPDFSQVEADATQVASDVRFPISYPEKRPFFVEGIEQFNTPNNLVYMRQIVSPVGAAKVTGKVSGTNVGVLAAVDDRVVSATGSQPVFAIARLRRDVGRSSTVGATFTDREDGDLYNRVFNLDSRIVFRRMYYVTLQYAQSYTGLTQERLSGPLWEAVYDRTGRNFGFHYGVQGVHRDFRTAAGFVQRTDFVRPQFNNRFTFYGARGALVEAVTIMPQLNWTWNYDAIFANGSLSGIRLPDNGPNEWRSSLNSNATLRGGWTVGLNPLIENYSYDARFHAGQFIMQPATGTVVPYTVDRIAETRALAISVTTPQFPRFYAKVNATVGRNAEFLEHSSADILSLSGTADWRPTQKLRVQGIYTHLEFNRPEDDRLVSVMRIPRLKVEYQVARPIFVRVVGQYDARSRNPLFDPVSGQPILLRRGDGTYTPTTRTGTNDVRFDWLFSYQPNPGTVVFAGYGTTLTEPDAFGFQDVQRVRDGFFFKVSYLFRM